MLWVGRQTLGSLEEVVLMWEELVPVDQADLVTHLPRTGVLGRVFDLGCDTRDYGPPLPCESLADWGSGTYELRVQYPELEICLDRPCAEVVVVPVLVASPIRVTIIEDR
jgi:hypothetical protein